MPCASAYGLSDIVLLVAMQVKRQPRCLSPHPAPGGLVDSSCNIASLTDRGPANKRRKVVRMPGFNIQLMSSWAMMRAR